MANINKDQEFWQNLCNDLSDIFDSYGISRARITYDRLSGVDFLDAKDQDGNELYAE